LQAAVHRRKNIGEKSRDEHRSNRTAKQHQAEQRCLPSTSTTGSVISSPLIGQHKLAGKGSSSILAPAKLFCTLDPAAGLSILSRIGAPPPSRLNRKNQSPLVSTRAAQDNGSLKTPLKSVHVCTIFLSLDRRDGWFGTKVNLKSKNRRDGWFPSIASQDSKGHQPGARKV
jgi:hypothetical protein